MTRSLRRTPGFAIVAALLLAAGVRAGFAAPGDHKFVSLRGRVADASGLPVPDVRIECGGKSEATALTGPDGRFEMTIDLGSLKDLLLAPARLSLRARQVGHRVVLPGDQPSLEFELRAGASDGRPVLEARSNFGIIADALLDDLSPPGERIAVLQVRFVSSTGAEIDSVAALPADRHSAVMAAESWITQPQPAPAPGRGVAPPPAANRPPPAAPESRPAKSAPPNDSRAIATPRERPRTPAPAPVRGAPASDLPTRPRWTHADSVRIQRENEQRFKIASAQAQRDSIWRAQHFASQQRKALADSLRAVRDALEDSLRRVRFGLPPRSKAVVSGPITRDSARAQAAIDKKNRAREKKQAAQEQARIDAARRALAKNEKKAQHDRRKLADRQAREGIVAPLTGDGGESPPPEAAPASTHREPQSADAMRANDRVPSNPSPSSGLHRVEPGARELREGETDEDVRARLGADTCSCTVRGTVEMEFHRLLSSPMKIEVSLAEVPAIRDTIELFMGSPRAFELRRVPCGRWSIALHPFSERPFGVTTPEEVAPFNCRERALRQVRIVIAPL